MADETGKVIGISGVFLKSQEHEELSRCYQDRIGSKMVPCQAVMLRWRDAENSDKERVTV